MNTVSRARLPRLSAASINARGLHPYPTHAEIPAKASADEMRRIADSITIRIPIAWRCHVCLLIGSGVLASAQIGKAIISISIIRDDMMLSPAFAGLIVAAFATLGAFFGLGAGIAVCRLDDRWSLVLGMAVITIGSLLGAVAPNEAILLAARVFEGAGFLGVALAIPSILARIVPSTERKFVMAVWSAYMPAGIMLMMLFGPLLPMIGWRNLWVATAVLTGGCCLILAISASRLPKAPPAESTATFSNDIIRIFCDPTCLTLAFAFFAYTSLMSSLAFALPSLLTSTNLALGTAGVLSAVVLAMSAIGHVVSGFLLRLGVPIWASIAAAFAGFAASALVIYAAALPPPAIALAAAIALGLGGLAPGALYAAAPQAAPHPTAVATTIGMLQQASNLGQFSGPLALGLWVEHFGWHAAPEIVAPAALLGISAAFAIRKAMRRRPELLPEPVILPLRRRSKRHHGYPPSRTADIWRGHSTPAQQSPISSNRAMSARLKSRIAAILLRLIPFGDRSVDRNNDWSMFASQKKPDASRNGLITDPLFRGPKQHGQRHRFARAENRRGGSLSWLGIWKP